MKQFSFRGNPLRKAPSPNAAFFAASWLGCLSHFYAHIHLQVRAFLCNPKESLLMLSILEIGATWQSARRWSLLVVALVTLLWYWLVVLSHRSSRLSIHFLSLQSKLSFGRKMTYDQLALLCGPDQAHWHEEHYVGRRQLFILWLCSLAITALEWSKRDAILAAASIVARCLPGKGFSSTRFSPCCGNPLSSLRLQHTHIITKWLSPECIFEATWLNVIPFEVFWQ